MKASTSGRAPAMPPRSRTLAILAAIALLVCAAFLIGRNVGASGTDQGSTSTHAQTQPGASTGMRQISAADLPQQARDTLRLIDSGGPFPYAKDGATFGNRERLLPQQKSGYYREYTVRTPGENDRGARRIVSGSAGERYYTADHYQSFAAIQER